MDVHPQFAEHGSFEHLKLGRLPAKHDPRTLAFAKYLNPSVLPQIPAEADYAHAVPSWPMYANDRWGDCTVAAAGHMIQAWTAMAGGEVTPAEADVEAAYIPGTGTDDTGRIEIDVLNYWRKDGIGPDKIIAYAAVDAKNLDHVRAAIYLFGGVYIGISLPLTAQGQTAWDVEGDPNDQNSRSAPGSWGGHAVPLVAYHTAPVDADATFKCITWGGALDLTARFHLAYTEELYAILSADLLKDGHTPAGFDLTQLQADLTAVTSQA